jgi:hypothetical protein
MSRRQIVAAVLFGVVAAVVGIALLLSRAAPGIKVRSASTEERPPAYADTAARRRSADVGASGSLHPSASASASTKPKLFHSTRRRYQTATTPNCCLA